MPMIKWRIEPTKLTRNSFHPSKCPSDFTDLANDIFTNVILQLSCLCKHSQDLFAELEQQSIKIATRTKQLTSRVNGLKERAATLNPTVEEVSLDDILSSKPFKSSTSKDASLQERPNAVLEIYTKSQPIPALDKLNPYRSPEEKDCVKLYSNPDFFFESWCGQVKQEVDKIRPARKKRPQKNQAKPERVPKNTRMDMMMKRVEGDIQHHPAQMKAAGQPPPPATDVNKTRPPSSSSRIPSSSFPPPPSPKSPLPPPPKPAGITPTQSIRRTDSESIRNPSVRPSILPPPKPVSSIDRDSVFDDPLPPPPSLTPTESPRDSLPPPPSTPSIPPPVMRQSQQNKSANRATLYSVGDFDRNTLILPPPPMLSPPPPMSPLAAPPAPPPPSQFAPAAPPPPPAPTLLPSSESSFQRTTPAPAPAENQKKRESRGDLLTAIRQGIRLRTVDEETKKQDVRNEPAGGGMFDVQTIMEMRRKALEEEDDDDDDEEFNDWEE